MGSGPWSAGWGGYNIESFGQWLRNGGGRLQKKNQGQCEIVERNKNQSKKFEPMKNNQVRKGPNN
jgi:hypothetical protein